MIQRSKKAVKVLFGKNIPGRDLPVFPDDLFLVSYPKSGNTWIRFLIGNLVDKDNPVTFENIERKVPDIYQNSVNELQRIPRPRVLKSHEYFDPRYNRVIYIVRDPRDVVISFYHYHIKIRRIEEDYPKEQYVARFISGQLDPLFASWGEHVGSWLGARQSTVGFLMIRYEDLLENTRDELHKIASFLSISCDERLDKAITLSSLGNMRKLEQEQAHRWRATKKSRKDKPFIRKGQAGSWRTELEECLVKEIEATWGNIMDKLNYKS